MKAKRKNKNARSRLKSGAMEYLDKDPKKKDENNTLLQRAPLLLILFLSIVVTLFGVILASYGNPQELDECPNEELITWFLL